MKRNFKSGQSLIEVVIIMTIVVMAAIALLATSLFTQKTARSASYQVQATKLVEQSIEQLRIIRDRRGYGYFDHGSFDGFCSLDTSNPEPSSWLLICPGTAETIPFDKVTFTREIKVENQPNQKKVTVTISWPESGATKTVSNVTFFSNF